MSTLVAPLIGLVIGFLAAIPVGPLNVAVITGGLKGRVSPTIAMILGGCLGDFLYCSATMVGISGSLTGVLEHVGVRLAFGTALVAYGIHVVRGAGRELDATPPPAPSRLHLHGAFWTGFLVSAFNPGLIVSWILIAGALHGTGWIGPGIGENLAFAVGAGAGMAAWLLLLLYLLARNRERLPRGWLTPLVRVFGSVLIGFGLYCILRVP